MSKTGARRGWAIRVGPWLLLAEVLVLVIHVMPRVAADGFAAATPQRALPVFAILAGLDAALAVMGLLAAHRWAAGRLPGAVIIGACGVLSLQTLALADAALAYAGHGGAMRPVVAALAACAAVDLGLAVALAAALRRSRRLG